MLWIAVAMGVGIVARVDWFAPGDFDFATAMAYHGLMVPLLLTFYLLAVDVVPVRSLRGRAFPGATLVAVLLVGPASLAQTSPGPSFVTGVQVTGMVLTDLLGLVLLVALWRARLPGARAYRRSGVLPWLLLSSLVAVTLAAPFGHLAGWGLDFGLGSLPGTHAWAHGAALDLDGLQEGFVSSHSHLIAAAALSGLVALAAWMLGYDALGGWRRRLGRVAIWLVLLSLIGAAVVYVVSAAVGWEPPTFFVSGPQGENGVPLDDVLLGLGECAWLLLAVALAGRGLDPGPEGRAWPAPGFRVAILLDWLCGFVAVVGLGLYIEFHETFYGGGEAGAPGAGRDLAFIRAHVVYAFMLLPIVLAFLLAVGSSRVRSPTTRAASRIFVASSVTGIVLGLAGEFLWVARSDVWLLECALFIVALALVAGVVGLGGGRHRSRRQGAAPASNAAP